MSLHVPCLVMLRYATLCYALPYSALLTFVGMPCRVLVNIKYCYVAQQDPIGMSCGV